MADPEFYARDLVAGLEFEHPRSSDELVGVLNRIISVLGRLESFYWHYERRCSWPTRYMRAILQSLAQDCALQTRILENELERLHSVRISTIESYGHYELVESQY